MVRFGDYALPHVLDAQIQTEPHRNRAARAISDVAYRADQTTKGRTVTISGEIRADSISGAALLD